MSRKDKNSEGEKGRAGSSLLMRFTTATGLLAVAVVLLAVIFFHAIRGDFFQGAFQSPLKDWSATIAGHIGTEADKAKAVARNHHIGVLIEVPDGRFAFGPDGEPVDADSLLAESSNYRRIDVHVQHGPQGHDMHYAFFLDKDQFSEDRSVWLAGLIILLLITIGLAYAIQLRLLRPLKWLRSGVEAVADGDFSTRVPVVRNDEIGRVARAFNQMTGRVQQMIDERERLLADVSHELRSPIARMKVALELLPKGDKRDAIDQDLGEMESLTTALLEREQVRTQAGQARKEQFNLVTVAAGVIDAFGDTPPGVQLNVPPGSLAIGGDEALVKILIHNLVDNALKFSLPDSKPVEVSLRRASDGIQIIVEDDGPGIPHDKAKDIFEPFVKLDPARGHRAGYGLGLNLCQRIVQAQGGSIEIQELKARGTRVVVNLGEPPTGA
jgi:signal transduction histidine kinase